MNPTNEVKTTQSQQMVVFELDGEEYALPILEAKEIVKTTKITPVPDSPPYILGVINLRGKIAPVLDMEKRFGLSRSSEVIPEHIIISEVEDGSLFGIRVDKVEEVLKLTQENFKPVPAVVSAKISGDYLKGVAVISEDQSERIILVLDLEKILQLEDVSRIQSKVTKQTDVVKPEAEDPAKDPLVIT